MKIPDLIYKKMNCDISLEEEEYLSKWLDESDENKEIYESLCKIENDGYDLSDLKSVDTQKSYKNFRKGIKKQKNTSLLARRLSLYAAAFVGILIIAYGYGFYSTYNDNAILSDYKNLVTLELENGEIHVLDQEKIISNDKGEKIADIFNNKISHSNNQSKELVYSTLRIPNGKRFDVLLSDNTHVFLNSGSTLRYPINFIKGQKRQIYLTGEAFFDVETDSENPFIVSTETMDIQVLGTEFNVSAYPGDLHSNTVLVEGSVRLSNTENSSSAKKSDIILKPGYKAEWNTREATLEFVEVNTDIYTGWMDGKLIFRRLTFEQIISRIERYYDVKIENYFTALDKEVFTASFENEPIEEVLISFSENREFDFSIENNNITITKAEKK